MARSGSYDWTLNRDEIIKLAYQRAGILQGTETIRADLLDLGNTLLNSMIKLWQADGIKLWVRNEATLFTAKQTASYSLGASGSNATESYVSTQIATAATISATTLTVDSTAGMTAADNIGIELDDGTRQWTTITTVDSATALTIGAALNAAAAVDNYVVTYTTKIQRPLDVINCRSKSLASATEQPMTDIKHTYFFNIPDKTTDDVSTTSTFYYDKKLDNGTIYLWPRPNNVDLIVNFTYYKPLDDLDAATNNLSFPVEWNLPVIVNLAAYLASWHNLVPILEQLKQEANQLYMQVKEFDRDSTSVRIVPNMRGTYRIIR